MIEKATKKKFYWTRKKRNNIFVLCMLAFPAVHFLVFWLWVNLDSIFLVFQNKAGEFVEFENLQWVVDSFTNNPYLNLSEATKNTLTFFFWNIFIEMPISTILAYTFYKKLPGGKFFTICLYIPSIIAVSVMVTVYKNFIGTDGPISYVFTLFGGQWKYPLTNPDTSMATILVYQIWTGYGLNIILFRSAMNRIPNEIFEAAALDGITAFKELIYLIVPMIWPVLSTKIILAVASCFGSSGPILLFTNGDYGTMTLSHSMYLQYKEYDMAHRAAAIGFIFTLIGIPLVFFTRWLAGKVGGEYEY